MHVFQTPCPSNFLCNSVYGHSEKYSAYGHNGKCTSYSKYLLDACFELRFVLEGLLHLKDIVVVGVGFFLIVLGVTSPLGRVICTSW